IACIRGNTGTLTTPLHIDFETALSAHGVRITDEPGGDPIDAVKYSGIEDLAVENGDGGDGGGNIHLFATAYSWVKNVDSARSIGHACNLADTRRGEGR